MLKCVATTCCVLLIFMTLYKIWKFFGADEAFSFTAADFKQLNFHQFRPYPISRIDDVEEARDNQTNSIAIVIIVKAGTSAVQMTIKSIRCYAEVQGYAYFYIDYSKNVTLQSMCPQEDFLFTRHCVLTDLMKRVTYDWFLFLGDDIGVINPVRRLEEFIPAEHTVNLVFYNRFYRDEIMADSYLIRNTQQSLEFLTRWADYGNNTKDAGCLGTDNGAIQASGTFAFYMPFPFFSIPGMIFMNIRRNSLIQAAILEFFLPALNRMNSCCQTMWWMGSKYSELFLYEACAQYLLSQIPKEVLAQKRLKIYEKGQGWSRDGRMTGSKWCERDLFLQGWKEEKQNMEWMFPFTSNKIFDRKCGAGELSRWSYDPRLKVDCLDLDLEMHVLFEETRAKHYQRLQTLRQMDVFPVKLYEKYGL
ncbi:unnamed protein product, partial [Mesorhabditis spiculigera]